MRILMAVDGSEHSRRSRPLLLRACGGAPHRVTVLGVTPRVSGSGLLVSQTPQPGSVMAKGEPILLVFEPAS